MAEKQRNKDRLKEITDGIEQGIRELFESDRYRQYLSTMSRFHRYSLNNVMLIHMQRPDATLVAGFNKWHDQFGRNVKKGEKGIKIIAPTPFKKKVEKVKLDPDTKAPMLDRDGNAIMEEKEIKIPMYKVVSVFDVSQTEGKPLPELVSNLDGSVRQYEVFMEALRRTSPVPMEIKPIGRDSDGFFSLTDQSITIRAGMSEVQTVCAAIHEIAHSKLHNYDRNADAAPWKVVMLSDGGIKRDYRLGFQTEADAEAAAASDGWRYVDENRFEWRLDIEEDPSAARVEIKDRRTEEVEAESISYAVCKYYNIETAENSFSYIATWSQGKKLKELRASLETINKTASELITDIDRHLAEIRKERGLNHDDLAAAEQPVAEAPKVEEALYLLDNSQYLHIQLSSAGTWDCTFYDHDTYKQQDGGFLDELDMTIEEARDVILTELGFDLNRVETIPQDSLADMLETLREAQMEPPVAGSMTQEEITAFSNDFAAYLVESAGGMAIQGVPASDMAGIAAWAENQLKANDPRPLSDALLDVIAVHGQNARFDVLSDRLAGLNMKTYISPEAENEVKPYVSDAMLPESPEHGLGEYPMPNEDLTAADLENCGYLDGDMVPISKEQAREFLDNGFSVYSIFDGGGASMCFDQDDIDAAPAGLPFAIPREEWEDSREFDSRVHERMDRQEAREAAFLSHDGNCFAIYQLKQGAELRDIRYEGLDWLNSIGRSVDRDNYELVYTAPLQDFPGREAALENLWYQFNNEHPADYRHPSMSVSDIVAIKQNDRVSYHYCDSFGFRELPAFQRPENYLKAAEMSMEDDYGMIDGIINNGPKNSSVDLDQQQKKPSVLEQLKKTPPQEHKKTAPKRSAEREI